MTENQQKSAFHNLIIDMILENDKDFREFQSILGMINTLFQDGKDNDLSMVLRLHFPEYYNNYKPFEVK